ncbi:hypothetical protein M885DRAFT_616788 [Pelagophyceae sp. CCMP2097]|nr:hypothetical protein M885DRAFT_616788 [Pelagophyceae sp. CCMP2097]|mmetsp:Transcript_10783/g.35905  ORF Transcript_10783/g.35905 Transcript_10783/m.35905 type:complete len:391 (-) Transcript_10783:58-1230(-)
MAGERVGAARWARWEARLHCVLAAVGLAGLLAFGQRSTGSFVRATAAYDGGADVVEAIVYKFNTWSTIHDFWLSGSRVFSLLLLLASGAGPFVLLAVIGVCGRSLSAGGLEALGHLSKFQRAMNTSACLFCVAFDVRIDAAELALRLVAPLAAGVLISEVCASSTCFLAALLATAAGKAGDDKARAAAYPNWLRVCVFLNSLVLLPLALCVPIVRLTGDGLIEPFVDDPNRKLSVVGCAAALARGSEPVASAAAAAWFAFFFVALPIADALALAAHTTLARGPSLKMMSALRAMSSLEVLLAVAFATSLELSIITEWVVRRAARQYTHACDEAVCYRVEAKLLPGTAALAVTTAAQIAFFLIVRNRLKPCGKRPAADGEATTYSPLAPGA